MLICSSPFLDVLGGGGWRCDDPHPKKLTENANPRGWHGCPTVAMAFSFDQKKLSWLNILSGSEFTAESEMLVVIHSGVTRFRRRKWGPICIIYRNSGVCSIYELPSQSISRCPVEPSIWPMSSWTAELEVKHRHWFSTGGNHHWNEHSSNISLIENHRFIFLVSEKQIPNWAPKNSKEIGHQRSQKDPICRNFSNPGTKPNSNSSVIGEWLINVDHVQKKPILWIPIALLDPRCALIIQSFN